MYIHTHVHILFTITTKIRNTFLCTYGYAHFLYFMVFGFYRMQDSIEAEREEQERWINKDVILTKMMMDSVEGKTMSFIYYGNTLLHIT